MSNLAHALHFQRTTRSATSWWPKREMTRNWLALGLLLSAWNAVDDGTSQERPEALRAYGAVSVRAMQRVDPEP